MLVVSHFVGAYPALLVNGFCTVDNVAACECGELVSRTVVFIYSVPHYKTGFLIFGHLVDYLQNHACYKHTQYIKMITDLY